MKKPGNLIPAHELGAVQPLAFGVEPFVGESLIGLVARATRDNVLGMTKVILEGAGLRLLHPGSIGFETGFSAVRLSEQLGCPVEDIVTRCHPFLGNPDASYDIRWGTGELSRFDILMERRRVSPASLATIEFHRADWMNFLLPYCPESLELLIDRCDFCRKPLGWRQAWGIGHCDQFDCRRPLRHPTGERLPEGREEGYRAFAALVSADPARRGQALGRLHPDLQGLPPVVLSNLIVHLGSTITDRPFLFHRGKIQQLPRLNLVTAIVRGMELLREWPVRLRSETAAELERTLATGPGETRKFQLVVRRLGSPRSVRAEQAAIIRNTLPEAFVHLGIALGGLLTPVVNGNTVCRMAGIDPADLRQLREANLIKHRLVADRQRTQAFYDRDAVTEFSARLRGSIAPSRLEQKLGIPRYAVEQLVCLGEVAIEDHPCVKHLHRPFRLRRESFENLSYDLHDRAVEGLPPHDTVPLGTAMKRIGGHLKPWGAMLGAMRSGDLPFWLARRPNFVRSAFVRPGDIEPFKEVYFDTERWPDFPFETEVTQIDAIEILNIDPEQMRRVMAAGDLVFTPRGVALVTDIASVLEMAKRTISAAEAGPSLDIGPNLVCKSMARYPTVRRCPVGWIRQDFDAIFRPRPISL